MTSGHGIRHSHSGKIALIIGSTEGIGFGVAQRLGREGAKVVINSRRQEKVDKAVELLKSENIDAIGVAGHAAKRGDRTNIIRTAVDHFGGIDILVNNAGTSPFVGLTSMTPEDVWDKLFDTNVKSGFFMTKECKPHLVKRGGGSVVFVSSILAYQHMDYLGVYSITKQAMLGVIKTLATEMASENVRINGIAPGIIKTKFSQSLRGDGVKDEILERIPMGRFGTVEDCAGAVSFLLSDDASYITGDIITITGGMPSRL